MSTLQQEELEWLAAEYVLGTLTPSERKQFQHDLDNSAWLQFLVNQWEQRLTTLYYGEKEVAPPPYVLRKLQKKIRQKQREGHGYFLSQIRQWQSFAMVSGLLALFLFFSLLYGDQPILQGTTGTEYIAVLQNTEQQPAWLLSVDAENRQLQVRIIQPPTLKPGRDFELWLIADQQSPLSLGLLSASNAFTLPENWQALQKISLAVSVEPLGGSPEKGPTGEIIALAKLLQMG